MLTGAEELPKESKPARDANSPPVAPTWRRSTFVKSLYPSRLVYGTPSKVMFGSAVEDHAGVVGAIDPTIPYPVSPVSGVPSQCSVAGLAVELGATSVYHAVVENVAGTLLMSKRLLTWPSEAS